MSTLSPSFESSSPSPPSGPAHLDEPNSDDEQPPKMETSRAQRRKPLFPTHHVPVSPPLFSIEALMNSRPTQSPDKNQDELSSQDSNSEQKIESENGIAASTHQDAASIFNKLSCTLGTETLLKSFLALTQKSANPLIGSLWSHFGQQGLFKPMKDESQEEELNGNSFGLHSSSSSTNSPGTSLVLKSSENSPNAESRRNAMTMLSLAGLKRPFLDTSSDSEQKLNLADSDHENEGRIHIPLKKSQFAGCNFANKK
ncbi:hypothetical protein Ciccas_006103 [Cichlidogyrus casuarinus]|uniref:Uncharacterized protein n=1 Tax=Cichlidogyrus casuarinus TaxID=1844966 RepID=A0ABD2Q7Y0_9PLAT